MDAIANHVWQSTIVALVAAALAWLLRSNRASARYWIWFAASMKFAVPFALINGAARMLSPEPVIDERAAAALNVVFNSSAVPSISETSSAVIMGMWLLGACVVLARWSWEWKRITTMVRQSVPMANGPVDDALRRIERIVGVATPTPIVATSNRMEPAIVGVFKPALLWPSCLSRDIGREHLEPIIAHEMVHVVRRDNLLALMHMAVNAMFWFHPVVWWIGARLIDERERACDEGVLALGHPPASYARGILKTCELCVASPLTSVAGISGGELKDRITRIMRNEPGVPLRLLTKLAIVLVVSVLAIVPIAAGSGSTYRQGGAQENEPREVHRPGGDVKAPRLIKEVRPQYTARALTEKIEGEVLMECVVKADGTVGDIRITRSLDPDLDQAAMDAAELWEFEPGTKNGKPVDVLVTIAMAFTLK
jgi:TonB family protein